MQDACLRAVCSSAVRESASQSRKRSRLWTQRSYKEDAQAKMKGCQAVSHGYGYRPCLQVRVALKASMAFPSIPELAFQAGLAMEWLTELCCTPLFYHRCL